MFPSQPNLLIQLQTKSSDFLMNSVRNRFIVLGFYSLFDNGALFSEDFPGSFRDFKVLARSDGFDE